MTRFENKTSKTLLGTAAALALFAFAAGAQAATVGNVVLTGTVAARCDIAVTPSGAGTGMDLDTAATDLNVATVNEDCNDPQGYTVTMTTANGATGGQLDSASTGDNLAYTVKYNAASVSFTAGSATVTDVNNNTPAGGVNKVIAISYTPDNGNAAAADYTDTLTVTIAAK